MHVTTLIKLLKLDQGGSASNASAIIDALSLVDDETDLSLLLAAIYTCSGPDKSRAIDWTVLNALFKFTLAKQPDKARQFALEYLTSPDGISRVFHGMTSPSSDLQAEINKIYKECFLKHIKDPIDKIVADNPDAIYSQTPFQTHSWYENLGEKFGVKMALPDLDIATVPQPTSISTAIDQLHKIIKEMETRTIFSGKNYAGTILDGQMYLNPVTFPRESSVRITPDIDKNAKYFKRLKEPVIIYHFTSLENGKIRLSLEIRDSYRTRSYTKRSVRNLLSLYRDATLQTLQDEFSLRLHLKDVSKWSDQISGSYDFTPKKVIMLLESKSVQEQVDEA